MSTGHQTAIQPWEAQLFTAAVLDQQFSKTKTLEDSTPLQNKIKMTFIIILRHYFPVYCVDICSNDASAMLAKIAGVFRRGSKLY